MSKSTRDNTKISTRKRPPETGTLIGVRLQRPDLHALDEWAAMQKDQPSRPEAVRRLLKGALARKKMSG